MSTQPLAARLRPTKLDDWVGHQATLAPLQKWIEADEFVSFILYAPPGTGKTSLFSIIQKTTQKYRVVLLNAISAGVKDVREAIDGARLWARTRQQGTLVMIDEIHRFSKSQQDALLAAVEAGDIILIGATTENPSFELNAALLSRVQVIRLEALKPSDIAQILWRANQLLLETQELAYALTSEVVDLLAQAAGGDARAALKMLEQIKADPSLAAAQRAVQLNFLQHDRAGDLHYQVVSAFIKSMRAGQVDSAMYYLARLWEAGEDPLFIARRMVIFASEDVGLADLKALALANAVRNACEFVGRPECYYALAQGVMYLSQAPKSRRVGEEFQKALKQVQQHGALPPPDFLINAQSSLDREIGRGRPRQSGESYMPLFD
jgi:putative ATPase